jgi:multidrug resistance efflux pump
VSRFVERLKRRFSRLPMALLWLVALGVVGVLSNGRVVSAQVARGYAEPVDFAVGAVEAGRLVEVNAVLGQQVQKGAVLGRFDPSRVESELVLARAGLAQKRSAVEAQRDALKQELERAGVQGVQARASESQDRAELAQVNTRVKRLEDLVAQQLATRTELDEALRQQAALRARVSAYDKGAAPPSAATPVGEALALRLQPYQRAVDEAEALVAQLELKKEGLTLKAPADGVVAVVLHRGGEVVPAGAEVVRVVAPPEGRVLAWVADRSRIDVAPGQEVQVRRPSSFGGGFLGTVVELGGEVELMPQRMWLAPTSPLFGRRVVVKLAGNERLLPGEALDVRL